MIEKVKQKVFELLSNDNSGHGIDHINRVFNLSLKFCEKEQANEEIVSLIALLHDVDDYKLFGIEQSENLMNAKMIMNECNVDAQIQDKVLKEIKCIGYSKSLKGIRTNTIEGKIVSDADMCDALGASGIIRTYAYTMKNNKPFFDKNIFPIENMTADKYTKKCSDSSVCHFFEKLLKLKDLMLTESGRKEAINRNEILVQFLYHLFEEENALDWKEYLDNYLEKNKKCN